MVQSIIRAMLAMGVQPSHGLRMNVNQWPDTKCDGDTSFFQGDWAQTSTTNPSAHYDRPVNDMYYDSGTERLKWDWEPQSKCKVSYMSKTSFCDMMDAHDLEQVIYVGDSLTGQMYLSLLHLIGASPDESNKTMALQEKPKKQHGKSKSGGDRTDIWFPATLACPSRTVHLHRRGANHNLVSYAWFNDYVKSEKKTLLVLNIGAHIHSAKGFTKPWDAFISAFKTQLAETKSGDKVVFRTTPPGHNNCDQFHKPFTSLDQFESKCSTQKFDWNLFEGYNDHVRETLSKEGLSNQVHVLDVVPMTKLRPDGHMEFEDHPKTALPEDKASFGRLPGIDHTQKLDCLHYKLPGVVDYWNHMLLNEIGTTKQIPLERLRVGRMKQESE